MIDYTDKVIGEKSMKSRNLILVLLLSIGFTSCKKNASEFSSSLPALPEGDESVIPNEDLPAEDEIGNNDGSQDENKDQDESNDSSDDKKYSFNIFDGNCLDEDGLEGLNDNLFAECGDLSFQNLSELDFSQKGYWKLNLSGSSIEQSNVKIGKIAHYEVQFDQDTVFTDQKNFFTRLFNQHINKYQNHKNKMVRSQDKVKLLKSELTALMDSYEDSDDENNKLKLKRKIDKKLKQVEKFKQKAQLAMNKMYRHQGFSSQSYQLAENESRMQNPKIKNNSWLSVTDKNTSAKIESQSDLLENDNFSISFWFRSVEGQKSEGRIINFLHSGNHSSLIFGVQKNQVFFGYRDEAKIYKRTNYDFTYGNGEWNHVVISYNNNLYNIYLNGSPIDSIEDSFYGFGEETATLGSYKKSGHIFIGDIDEVSTWKLVLDTDSVSKLYNEGIFSNLRLHPDHQDIARWYRFGDKQPRHIAGEVITE